MKITRFTLILLFLFLFSGTSTFAQDQLKIDSLSALLLSAEGEERLTLLIDLSIELNRVDPEQSFDYAEDALRLARQIGKTELIYEAMVNQGAHYQGRYMDKDALRTFEEALAFCEEKDYIKGKADVLYRIGRLYFWMRDYDQSDDYLNQSIAIARDIKDLSIEAQVLRAQASNLARRAQFEEAFEKYNSSIEVATEANDHEILALCYSEIGGLYFGQGDFEEAIMNYQEAKKYRLQLGKMKDAAWMDAFVGNCYTSLARYNQALESYLAALPVFEEYNDTRGISNVYNGMAIIYEAQNFYEKAEEFYLKKLEISRAMGDQSEIALTLNNLGILFSKQAFDTISSVYGQEILDSIIEEPTDKYLQYYSKAINYFQQSLEITRELNNQQQIAQTLNNIGLNYLHSGKLDLAESYFEQSLVISEELQDARELAMCYLNLGGINLHKGMYDRALNDLNQSLDYALEINVLDIIETVYLNMSQVYERLNNHRRALDYYKLHSSIKDSITNKSTRDAMADMQVKYETDVLEKNNQLLMTKSELDGARLRQQRIAIIFFIFVLLAISGMGVLLIRQSNQRKRTNKELSQKNDLITEQKKEITDSIHYASRIQSALMPPGDYIDKLIPERFILYMPRDIVSGDYYWLTEKNEKVVCIAADCTGHGVPGAFMSMLGISFLNEIVSRHEDVHTDVILNELRSQVIKSLHQTGKEGGSQDGMDVALFILDLKNMTLEFSGANNPLFLFRNGEMIELKSDKMPIGIHTRADIPFTRHNIEIEKNDMIYTFSDGYPDQFGGPHQKKFMIKNFKKLLAEIHNDPPEAQKKALIDSLNSWMTETEQVDDIIVIGVRI